MKPKWKTLVHNGPLFTKPYKCLPKNVKLLYNKKVLKLRKNAEEAAGLFAKLLDNRIIEEPIFRNNFFVDWRKVMTEKERRQILDLNKCDFRKIYNHYKMQGEKKRNKSSKTKSALKIEEEKLRKVYGFCMLDGQSQEIGNFKMEPAAIFRGRGNHPKLGKIKPRIFAKDVIINIGKNAPIPKPFGGGKWKFVIHNNMVTWLASWPDSITASTKYMRLSSTSKLTAKNDFEKFEKARLLGSRLNFIRARYNIDMKSKDVSMRQKAVALYFIDELALRVGSEKKGVENNTVGCCSLRIEHLKLFTSVSRKRKFLVQLDFPGKDTIRYQNLVAVPKFIYGNLTDFTYNKYPKEKLFHEINASDLNKYLDDMMKGLTAKVFRTLHSSQVFKLHLQNHTKSNMTLDEKIFVYNQANRDVAILCNHFRAMPKRFTESMKNTCLKIDTKLRHVRRLSLVIREQQHAAIDKINSAVRNNLEKKISKFGKRDAQLKKLLLQTIGKVENKELALGTSKLNYIDPRISVAWCKRWNVPIDKIYNRSQRKKFEWAIAMTDSDFEF